MLKQFLFLSNANIFIFYSSITMLGISAVLGSRYKLFQYFLLLALLVIMIAMQMGDKSFAHQPQHIISFCINFFVIMLVLSHYHDFVNDKSSIENIELYLLTIWSSLGMIVAVKASSFITLFVGLELYSIPLYTICAFSRFGSLKSAEAGLKAFLFGGFASAILLIGIALMYSTTGSFDIENSIIALQQNAQIAQASIILLMILIGLCIKMGVAPMHLWTLDVFEGTTTYVVHYISTVSKLGLIFIVITLLRSINMNFSGINIVMMTLGIACAVFGSFSGLLQNGLYRLIAISSVSHVGYIIIIASIGSYEVAMFYALVYTFTNAGFIAGLYAIKAPHNQVLSIKHLAGLFHVAPFFTVLLTIILLSMAGIPPIAGFIIKLYVIMELLMYDWYAVLVIVLLTSVISAVYYLRIIASMFFIENNEATAEYRPLFIQHIVLFVTAFYLIIFVLYYNKIMLYTQSALY